MIVKGRLGVICHICNKRIENPTKYQTTHYECAEAKRKKKKKKKYISILRLIKGGK